MSVGSYQSHQDRNRQIGFTVKSLVLASIALSIYLIVLKLMSVFNYQQLEIIVNCLYFQIIGAFSLSTMLQILKVSDINFDVYKQPVS